MKNHSNALTADATDDIIQRLIELSTCDRIRENFFFKCSAERCDSRLAYSTEFWRHKFQARGIYANQFKCPICKKKLSGKNAEKTHETHNIQDS